MKYRPEIDGLRAIAVIPVILFHAKFAVFSGGFVGVDIFFVISGYLITTIIIEDLEKDSFSIWKFYERRARRILPALLVVMLLCIPPAWVLMNQSDFTDFSASLVSTALFISNILFWQQSGYFDTGADLKPLLHTWSLAVEEQFYILFPIFMVFLWKYSVKTVLCTILVLTLFSLTLSEIGWRYFPNANYFLTPTRMWELFIGSVAAIIVLNKGISNRPSLSFLGLCMVLVGIFVYHESTPYPSLYTAVPVIGVFLIILFTGGQSTVGKLLSLEFLVKVGMLSYSAYLLHQPIFVFTRFLVPNPSLALMLGLSLTVIPLAYLNWRFVENPFRYTRKLNQNDVLRVSLFSILFVVSIGLVLPVIHKESIRPVTITAEEIIKKKEERFVFLNAVCVEKSWEKCDEPEKDKINILTIGDSHAVDGYNSLYLALEESLDAISFSTSTLGGCPPHNDIRKMVIPTHPHLIECVALNADRYDVNYLNSYDIIAISLLFGWYSVEHLVEYINYLRVNYKGKVIVFGSTFAFSKNLPDIYNFSAPREPTVKGYISNDPRPSEDFLERAVTSDGYMFVSKVDEFCTESVCKFKFDGDLLTYDEHHLSLKAVQEFTDPNKSRIRDYVISAKP